MKGSKQENIGRKKLWAQMETRMNEMLDRRRRLIKYTLKKERESRGEQVESQDETYKDLINKKNTVVTRFSSLQLEDLLTSSTKNVAHEVVSCMIPKSGENGLLLTLEKEVAEIKAFEAMNRGKSSYATSLAGSFANTQRLNNESKPNGVKSPLILSSKNAT
jgi:hypothetical protein